MVISIGTETTDGAGTISQKALTPHVIASKVLHDATTWELHAFRGQLCGLSIRGCLLKLSVDAFIAGINEQTKSLQDVDLQDLLSDTNFKSAKKKGIDIRDVSAAFGVILHVPAEYLPRTSRIELIRRALVADMISVRNDRGTDRTGFHSVLLMREFLRRMFIHFGAVEYSVSVKFMFL